MQLYQSLLLTALPAMVAATCYGSGPSWSNKEAARSWVHDACYNNGGMFTGYYAPLQSKAMCVEGNFFQVKNENNRAGFDLGDNDCYNRLTDEIFGCNENRGGESHISGWFFRADPGSC